MVASRSPVATLLWLLLGCSAWAAVVKVGNTCTVTPLSADGAATAVTLEKRGAENADEPTYELYSKDYQTGVEIRIPLGKPGTGEHYPRVMPGSPEADPRRVFEARKDAQRKAQLDAQREIADANENMVVKKRETGETGETGETKETGETGETLGLEDKRQARLDDTPQILDAFKQCGKDGSIVFKEGTYNIRQVMNTTDLRNCDISIYGKFLWSADNIQYWLSRSFSVTYASLSTSWLFGGRNVSMRGHGKALFDGNGQVWIDQNRDQSNQKGRPINLTIWRGTNILIDGITWRQSQFWHTFVAHSQNVTMTNLDMNTTSNSRWTAVNTDGTDTWNSRDIYISNWTVTCGDDCISVKGNSTNIHVSNIVCHESGGMCVGSIGSNAAQPDYVDNVVFENVSLFHSSNAAWIKTYPGQGHVRNVTFRNIHSDNVNQPIYVTSCIYSGQGCDTSRLRIEDITWENITGTARYNVAAGIHCSAAAPCRGLRFRSIDIRSLDARQGQAKILCSNMNSDSGLQCTGSCPGNWPQQLSGPR